VQAFHRNELPMLKLRDSRVDQELLREFVCR
jgi:hypothetical protein